MPVIKEMFFLFSVRVRNNESSHRKFLESRKVVLRELEVSFDALFLFDYSQSDAWLS